MDRLHGCQQSEYIYIGSYLNSFIIDQYVHLQQKIMYMIEVEIT